MLRLQLNARVDLVGGFEIVQHHHVGVGGAAGLFKTAVGLLQHPFQPVDHLADHAGVDLDGDATGAGDSAGGQINGKALSGGEFTTFRHGHWLAVGQHFDLTHHGVAHGTARGRDLEFMLPKTDDPDRQVGGHHLVGFYGKAQRGRLYKFKPTGLGDFQVDLLRRVQIVEDAHRHRHFIAHRQETGQIRLDKEILEDLHAHIGAAQIAILIRRQHANAPGGDRIGNRHLHLGVTVGVCGQFRQPEERFGEELTQARRLALIALRRCGNVSHCFLRRCFGGGGAGHFTAGHRCCRCGATRPEKGQTQQH